ncbi:hypothetical protein GUJ93_ZPchr0013g37477 [Zizania palustris]|uniref:TFIIB-type domain-containing protein n=1 Tax=Zizania palustris TaxID=103762 RepID=A0A8J5WYB0_ZIZPA|nr:hypothetical protein GUJ93_ZPchr0013g37477 [Zizania palustris]
MSSFVGNEQRYCPSCRCWTAVVLDRATGDTICTQCALVLEERYIYRRDIGVAHAPAKRQAGANAGTSQLPVHINVGSSRDKTLVDAFHAISDMADRLGLVATVRDRAKELFKNLDEANKLCPRGPKRQVAYAACLNEGKPRTLKLALIHLISTSQLKELASVSCVSKDGRKEIGKVVKIIKELLGEQASRQAMAADYMTRFGSQLGMDRPELLVAKEAARRLEMNLDVRRSPRSIVAAIIYMVLQRTGTSKSVHDVSTATGVTEATIKEKCVRN